MSQASQKTTQEFSAIRVPITTYLFILLFLLIVAGFLLIIEQFFMLGILVAAFLIFAGMPIVIQPNDAVVMTRFGTYVGTLRESGVFWQPPFVSSEKISLKIQNFSTQELKVNDKTGSPIEIAAVIVWRVQDTAKAIFDVEDYDDFVRIQSETALRHLATQYPYDSYDDEISLRENGDELAESLRNELNARLQRVGVEVLDARLSHLAYSPEIAGAMLQRQQASAIIAARTQIVEGAVGMVETALNQLKERNIVDLDEEKKAQLVSNLLVVLSSEKGTQPIVSTNNQN